MHEKCEEIFENAELNLEARCTCGCHITENKIKVVPDSSQSQRTRRFCESEADDFDEIGVANTDEREDDR